ncbi:NAD-dependent epimerase/dehydratase family protein [Wocania ichthyoenteri]|uniref:NAD-dependent epimerase/dehydratase family protein n=1 Tax=Wocania ichthyoenteri TaxID=1230531 RepID=UPI00053DB9AE|nr:NAD(P)-dependent oxidoreductase [Wocania ichthyoenteri]
MKNYPTYFTNEEQLEEALSRPSERLVKMMKELDGNFIFLGVAGKMGVSMARMAKRACIEAQVQKRIIGVSRFSSTEQQLFLEESGVETIKGDLLDLNFINSLPEVKNVIYLAGMKFGTKGNESFTWAMNSFLPGLVAEKFKNSSIVAFSTGCVYPLVKISSSGSKETDTPEPVGEYAQSCLGRERLFEYGSIKNGTPTILIRLNYAVEMRYGVLVDIATKVHNQESIDLTMGYANVIWQGNANEMILRSIQQCTSPANRLNISGSELISIADVAKQFGKLMGKEVRLIGSEAESALLVNVSKSHKLLDKPEVSLNQVIKWTANWLENNNRLLGKATHFEVRDGKY